MGNQLQIEMKADVAHVQLYGVIGRDVTAQEFARGLDEVRGHGPETMELRIHTPGGLVADGISMFHRLADAGQAMKVRAVVESAAWSAGSVLMLAAHERVGLHGSHIMVHDGKTPIGGTASELRAAADQLDKINADAGQIYAERTNWSYDEARAAMGRETWLNPTEAYAAGFLTQPPAGNVMPSMLHDITPEHLAECQHPPQDLTINAAMSRHNSDLALQQKRDTLSNGKSRPKLTQLIYAAPLERSAMLNALRPHLTATEFNQLEAGRLKTLPPATISKISRLAGMPAATKLLAAANLLTRGAGVT